MIALIIWLVLNVQCPNDSDPMNSQGLARFWI